VLRRCGGPRSKVGRCNARAPAACHVVTSRDPRETASGRTRSGRPARAADDTRYAYAYGTRASARPLIGDT
jgi:hypothetical protein